MEAEVDLQSASRETLLAVIGELRRRVEHLEAQLASRGPSAGMPGNKRSSKRRRPETRAQRKRRLHGFARRRMEPTRQVIDLPMAPAEVIEHLIVARTCPLCDKRRLPQEPLAGLAMGRRRLGPNLVSLIVTLREEGRLPVRSILWYLPTVHQLRLSLGAIIDVVHAAAQRAQPVVAEMLKRIRGSAVVHADETGWREDGVNGYVWTYSTPTERYFLRRGRGKGVVDEVLGESLGQGGGMLFSGVLVSDFYAAYDHYPGLKQRCWVHLFRDIDELEALYPQDTALTRWATAVRQLYDRAKACADARSQPPSGYQPSASADQLTLEKLLLSLCQPSPTTRWHAR